MGCVEGARASRRAARSCTTTADTIYQASKLAKEYEKQGGDYENEAGSKNEPKKGEPEAKSESKKKSETS